MHFQRIFAVLTMVFSGLGIAGAQIIGTFEKDGKTVTCMHSGLMSDFNDCGVRSDWYTYVFVGSISSITPAKGDEKRIQVMPEEVFSGEPASPLTLLTSQAPCLPDMAVGDRWLFFLRKEDGKPIVLDFYGNDSHPVAYAQEQIETLRRLKTIGDFGILRGRVLRGAFFERKAVPNVRVLARLTSGNMQFVATTDSDGHYEFPPVPPGEYKLTADPVGSFQPDEGGARVTRGSCWHVTLSRSPHAELGGHVRLSDGSPLPEVDILIMREDETWFTTLKSDEHGHFHSDMFQPGKYVIGINLPGAPPWKVGGGAGSNLDIPSASLYYPGVLNRSAALAIMLAEDEKRDDIDFVVSKQ
jgi:Carboxypeptidase regulatory-like domain